MTALTSEEIQRENLAQWWLGRFIPMAYEMDDEDKEALARVGIDALRHSSGNRAIGSNEHDK